MIIFNLLKMVFNHVSSYHWYNIKKKWYIITSSLGFCGVTNVYFYDPNELRISYVIC